MKYTNSARDRATLPSAADVLEGLSAGVGIFAADGTLIQATGMFLFDLGYDGATHELDRPAQPLNLADLVPTMSGEAHPLVDALRQVLEGREGYVEVISREWRGTLARFTVSHIPAGEGERRQDCVSVTLYPLGADTSSDLSLAQLNADRAMRADGGRSQRAH